MWNVSNRAVNRICCMKSSLSLLFVLLGLFCHGQNLIPRPERADRREGEFLVAKQTEIYSPAFPDLFDYLNDHIERVCGYRLAAGGHRRSIQQISIEKHEGGLSEEGYLLDISPSRITIRANDRGGAFYALQTLFQLMPVSVYRPDAAQHAETFAIPCFHIEDAPRFAYRGVMLDVSRNFSDKAAVMRYIDWMARHKLNTLHWHLTDDNGWRVEIKKYPELTCRGAWRGPGEVLPPSYGSGNERYGGFYTQQDVREIVDYAAFRNVEIIPEIDLPGHSQTLTSVYPETFCRTSGSVTYKPEEMRETLCAGREENFEMLRDILQELAGLFPSKYIHIGGDEVSVRYWRNCPRCRALMTEKKMKTPAELRGYFVHRLEDLVHSVGKTCAAWNEAVQARNLRPATLIYGWENVDVCRQAAAAGQPVVMMPASYCYIDMKQHPWDRGHTWAGRVDVRRVYDFEPADFLSAERLERVRGVEAAQWAELLNEPERFAEYQGYPRLCALAEVGWTQPGQRDWNDFYRRLTSGHLERLGAMGIRFRMFPPQTEYRSGVVTVTPEIAGVEIRYTTDLSEPDESSALYTEPLRTDRPERYRFRAFGCGGYSTAVFPVAELFRAELAPAEQRVFRVPLKDYVTRDGLWLLSFTQRRDDAMIVRLEVSGPDTAYTIIRNGQKINPLRDLRLYADSANRTADLLVTLKNNSSKREELTLNLRPSPYTEPAVSVTSSLTCSGKFPIRNSADYQFSSYVRTVSPCKAGDYILFAFDEPVDCEEIDVRTGLPDVTRYIVTDGTAACSADGKTFGEEIPLKPDGSVVLRPSAPVRSVRISIRGGNGETILGWQDWRVVPRL